MQKGYWVSCYREIYDPNKLSAYAELAKVVVESVAAAFWFVVFQSTPRVLGYWKELLSLSGQH